MAELGHVVAGSEPFELSARLRQVASDAAVGVGAMLREGFAVRGDVASKADSHDLVTEYDGLAEAQIRETLTGAVPDSSVWGEEEGLVGTGEVTWYVDPIDGTNNFAAGVPFFCVAIAGLHRGRVLAGVVYDPVREELFAADLAGASNRPPGSDPGRPLHGWARRCAGRSVPTPS